MTLAGLNSVNLSQLNTFQQVILFLLIILGSAIWVSIAVVHVRRKAFERKFTRIVEEARQKRRDRSISNGRRSFAKSINSARPEVDGVVVRGRAIKSEKHEDEDAKETPENVKQSGQSAAPDDQADKNIQAGEDAAINGLTIEPGVTRRITFASPSSPVRERQHGRILSMQGIGARHNIQNHPLKAPLPIYPDQLPKISEAQEHPFWLDLLSKEFVGRNSQFKGLSLADREHLGGVEYRALCILAVLVPAYFISWQLLGCIGLGAYVANNRADVTKVNAEHPWWVGAFIGVSAFNNSGMSLLDANMVAFQTSDYTLITTGLLILAGNTCYPVFLRLTIWTFLKLVPDNEFCHDWRIALQFLLDHPRRCYTNLFPSKHTWWLLASLIVLNGIDWAAFEILNIGNSTVTSLPQSARALDGLFQALAVRSGGFYVVPIPGLRIGLLILYVIMMYISVYPVVITMRNSNVYEERSLGIYADDPQATVSTTAAGDKEDVENRQQQPQQQQPQNPNSPGLFTRLKRTMTNKAQPTETSAYFIRQQLRGQLAHDLWWIVLAVLFITIIETSNFERDPVSYSVFNILFEVVSAYGCVGISLGLPNEAYSFSGGWHKFSKLILCAVMLRGRHRGLPVAIDRAVLLPGEHLAAAEEEDAQIRLERSQTINRAIV
ncbi:hypothetical protein ACLMJK_008315 [Lecanora helva]